MFTDAGGEIWLTVREAAEYIASKGGRAAVSTLNTWRSRGGGPPWKRIHGRVHYSRSGIDKWMEDGTTPVVRSTSELRHQSKSKNIKLDQND
jgi:hypothetical protein